MRRPREPLISTQDLDCLLAVGIAVIGTPLWLLWRTWRALRTGSRTDSDGGGCA
jgi:hypothetical protein